MVKKYFNNLTFSHFYSATLLLYRSHGLYKDSVSSF